MEDSGGQPAKGSVQWCSNELSWLSKKDPSDGDAGADQSRLSLPVRRPECRTLSPFSVNPEDIKELPAETAHLLGRQEARTRHGVEGGILQP
jgi:hypothetical protein